MRPTRTFPIDSGKVTWGHEVTVGYFAQDHRDSIPRGVSVIEWLHSFDPGASQQELRGLLGQMLFSGDDALKRTEYSFRRRGGADHFLPSDAAETQLPGSGRTHEPSGSGIHQRPEHCAAAVSRHGAAGDARSRCDRRSGNADLALRIRAGSRTSRGPTRSTSLKRNSSYSSS